MTKPTLEEQILLLDHYGKAIVGPDMIAAILASLRKLQAIEAQPVPVAWIRFCSDGLYEGPIMNSAIEEVRKKSGAWTPLYAAITIKSQPVPVEPDVCIRVKAESKFGGYVTKENPVVSAPFAMKLAVEIDALKLALQAAQQELKWKERDRQYHMDAINRLASFLAMSGTSFEVVKAAIDNMTRMVFENHRLRKDCGEHATWRADLADKLHDSEAQNKRLELELAQLNGEKPYGN